VISPQEHADNQQTMCQGIQVHQEVIDPVLTDLPNALHAFLWIDRPQTLDNLEVTVPSLGNVHVHSHVMLTGYHVSRTTRACSDLCVVQCPDDIFLLQRTRLFHRSLPKLQASVQA
jgi:hypothetical protein